MSTMNLQVRSARARVLIVGVLIVGALVLPAGTRADTATELQSQMISILQQIITLQKQLIETLTTQVTELSAKVRNLSVANSSMTEATIGSENNPKPAELTAETTMQGGCWAYGTLYPEGMKALPSDIKKPQIITGSGAQSYVICTKGRWVVQATGNVVSFPR